MNGPATIKSIQEQIDQIGENKNDLIAGIRIVGDGPDMEWNDLKSSLEFTREQEIAGHCLWFSRGVLEVYPDELKAFYDVANKGHANNPFKPGDWRKPPVVAEKSGDAWKFHLTQKGRYRVIVKKNGRWAEVNSQVFEAGDHTMVDPEAQAVELLNDRR
jgi:hypothetical protein